ncbi:SelL-related redox protein [Bacteriovorax sp. PP10]|uniref:SelL-related redox protein n=1 Tax=Bacteriovorax antarcticus TaxID=3088717 RepID=A0ABU5VYR2_9BACT|nr:SelL-related redox protein [Bacteriovorax sp. PP10]MEA9358191.1 SelL-related redox protein [Bacteriovorax sp. PP10]
MKSLFTLEVNQKVLRVAAYYSVLWGFIITLLPRVILNFFHVDTLLVIEFWQFFGMIVGVSGIGYFIASFDPGKHWPTVFIGFLGNLMATFVFAKALTTGHLPPLFSILLLISTAIWIIPFYYILQSAYEENTMEESPPKQFHDLLKFVRTSQNKTLADLSAQNNVLLVFVRHFGCTFCRETVSEMAKIDRAITGRKLTLVFVHMSDPSYGDEFFSKYYDHPVHHISDPGRNLYKSLNLKRGSLYQLLGPMTWVRGVYAGIFKGHGLGEFEGDTMQLGGVFILSNGQIIFEQKANCASDLFHFNTLPEL